MKEMKKMIFACMSAFLLVGSMFIMPLNTVSASTSIGVKENVRDIDKTYDRRDNLGGLWKVRVEILKKEGDVCNLRVSVKHAYEKKVKKAQVRVILKNKTETRNVSGMKQKDSWEQWTWSNNASYCSLKNVEIRDVELNK